MPDPITLDLRMDMLSVGEQCAMLREGSSVKRWHTEHLTCETVANHSHGVAMILCLISPAEYMNAHLLKAAIFHDLAEKEVGDISAPTKWANPTLADALDQASANWERKMGVHVILTEGERLLLKIADYMDAAFYALEQRKMGNRYADDVFARLCQFFKRIELAKTKFPKAIEMWDWIHSEYYDKNCQ